MKQFNLKTKSVKSLFLLLALLLGGTSPTWADELTIFGSSTQTRSDLPIYGYNADTSGDQCEFVVPASLLSSMNGKNITGLKFYTATFSWGTNIPEYKVYLKEVASTTLSAFSGDTDATTVYTGTLSLADGVMTVTFAEPYEYNGGNLLIGTKVSKTGSYRPTNSSTFYGDTSSDVQCGRSSMGGSYFIPRTTFVYESANVSGPAMTVKDGTSKITTGYSYNFGLTTAGTTKTFALKNPGDANVALSVNATTGYTAELSSSTLVAGGEATLTITMNATGDGTVTITSTTEGIDDFVINVSGTVRNPNKMWCNFADGVPTGWTNSGNWSIATTGAPENTSGAGYAYNTSYGTNKLMYSPLVTIADGEKLYLMAKGHGSTASWNVLKIQYSSDGNTWTTAKDLTGITNSWQSVEVTEIPAGNWYIGFYGSYAYFTDIYGGKESTSPVLALSQSSYDFGLISANTTSSDITITNTGKSELTGMTITSDNENFTVSVTDNATTIAANGGTTKFNVTMAPNVTGAQSATITIASDNADDLTFTATGAVAKAGTSTVDFNDNQLPNGWSKAGNTSFTDGAAYFYYSTNTLTSPKLTFVAGDFLVIKAKMASGYGYVTVKGSTNGTTFTEIKKLDSSLLNQTDYTTCIISDIATTVKYIQLDGYYCYVDEIMGLTYAPVLSVTTGDPATAVSTPANYDFGECAADATVTYNFANAGAGTINITNVAITGDGAAAYSTNWTESVAAPFDLVITRTYDATKAGTAQDATVTVTTSEGDFVINVTGTDKAANAPELAVSTNAIDFGKVAADAVETVTVTNNGTGSMTVDIASDNAAFEVSAAQLTEIGAGESKTFDITFKYGTPYGVKNGNVTVTPTYDATAAQVITVTGKAKDPNVWSEDFSGNTLPTGWDAGTNWTIADGVAKGTWSSTASYLTTAPLTVSATTDELTFDYVTTAGNVSITIQMSKDGGAWETCAATPAIPTYMANGTAGTAILTGFEPGNYQFRFKNDDYNLDNFEGFVLNLPDHMASITEYTIPASSSYSVTMKEGQSFDATVTVKEQRGVAEELTAKLYMGEEVIGTKTGSVAANGTETLTITCTPTVAAPEGAQMHIEVEWAGTKMTTENVTRYVAAITYLTLDETSSDAVVAGTYDNVTLKRKFNAGWNTVCLPFTISNVEGFFGAGAKAYEFSGYTDEGALSFSTVSTLTASYPYVVYAPTAITENIELTNITIASNDASAWYTRKTDSSYNAAYFRGTYAPVAAGAWTKNADTDIIYGVTSDGHIKKAGASASIKGFRAYFDLPAGAAAPSISFEDTTTGITIVKQADELDMDGKAYNLNGQRVNSATKGLYIVNGKKVVIK